MLNLPVYLDNNATTPMDERVLEAMTPYFIKHFGNAASRSHAFGWEADAAVEYARGQVARLIQAEPGEIIFTSGATESDNLALKGVVETYGPKRNHIITVMTEHKAVLDSCRHLETNGARVTYLPVNKEGLMDCRELEKAIRPETILISVLYAHNETGVIQPIAEISAIARKHGILFFSDATQAVGKISVDVVRDGIDLLAFSGHKIYGPKGVGVLYARRRDPRVRITAQMDGGGHEKGRRSGTLNVPGIVGLGKACELCSIDMKKDAERTGRLRDLLENGLLQTKKITVNGSKKHRLAHVSHISYEHPGGPGILAALGKTVAVSSGSACMSAIPGPSFVLKAMGLSDEKALSSVRFSLGRFTTEEEIGYTVDRFAELLADPGDRD